MGRGKDKKKRKRRSKTADEKVEFQLRKRREKAQEQNEKKRHFIAAMARVPAASHESGDTDDAIDPGYEGGPEQESSHRDTVMREQGESSDSDESDDEEERSRDGEDDGEQEYEERVEVEVDDVFANGEEENDDGIDIDDIPSDEEEEDPAYEKESVMGAFIKAVVDRLKIEVSKKTKTLTDYWLLEHLRENEFWIRACHARKICAKLNIPFHEREYYRDVLVWLPDVQWGHECTPGCPECECANRVGSHGFRTNHFARRIYGLEEAFFIITRRYICHNCRMHAQEGRRYTFMGWNAKSVALLPHNKSLEFPAILTHKSGVAKVLVDLMRPLFDKGIRPNALSDILLEIQSKRHTKDWILAESFLRREKARDPSFQGAMFSEFNDRTQYDGRIPSGGYLASVYKKYHHSIRSHQLKEAKKRGVERFSMDANQKEPKHLARYHGKPLFTALVTIKNEWGEPRTHFRVVTDGHDQYEPQLNAMINTAAEYGQQPPQLAITDKPPHDKPFLMGVMPSLKKKQQEFDAITAVRSARRGITVDGSDSPGEANASSLDSQLPPCTVNENQYQFIHGVREINAKVDALKGTMWPDEVDRSIQAISFDLEWDVIKNAMGYVEEIRRVALVQLGYHEPVKSTRARPRVLVRIERVTAPSVCVTGLKRNNRSACLGDFGVPPFDVMLPLTMIMPYAENRVPLARGADVEPPNEGDILPFLSTTGDMEDTDNCIDLFDTDFNNENGGDCEAQDEFEDDDSDRDDDDADPIEDGAADRLTRDLDATAYTAYSRCQKVAESMEKGEWHHDPSVKLDPPPAGPIEDKFSSVLGDGFHCMDRPKVPVKHTYKKPYYVAFQEAMFAWNQERMNEVVEALLRLGLTREEIEAKKYFNVSWFRAIVERCVLPPSRLYWRVRAVFELYGPMIDPETGKPLFNDTAWKKANNLLMEILAGYYSDPPGVSFYHALTNEDGTVKKNQLGFTLLGCSRGTGDVESGHKQFRPMMGTWPVGIEMSDCLLQEHYFRALMRASIKNRPGFPKIGHYDTWLIDLLQLLVEDNHNKLIYPGWSNTSDFVDTEEENGVVPLHDSQLRNEILALDLDWDSIKLTADQRYLARKMKLPLAPTPVWGRDELRLFSRCVLESPVSPPDFEQMAFDWLKHVNGKTIMPKLPVYLRMKYNEFSRNQRVRDAAKALESAQQKLHELNDFTEQPAVNDDNDFGEFEFPPVVGPAAHAQLPEAPSMKLAPTPIIVGGTRLDLPPVVQPEAQSSRHGKRGKDKHSRKPRTCKLCVQNNGRNAATCNGARTRGDRRCQYFNPDGTPIQQQSSH